MSNDKENPKFPFLHMWVDENKQSRIDETFMTGFGKKNMGEGADPQWLKPFPGKVSDIKFTVLPVGWVGDWHETPKPQWVIPTKGTWFIETQDGNRVEMGPGDIHFGQDIGTKEIDSKKGHKSGTVGDEPCYQMVIQFETSPAAQTKNPF
ncbi:hypothetical protein ACXGQW_01035 [Wenyingzhuangia sp. IMCC45533]